MNINPPADWPKQSAGGLYHAILFVFVVMFVFGRGVFVLNPGLVAAAW